MADDDVPKLEDLKPSSISAKVEEINDYSLRELIYMIRLERTSSLRNKKEKEMTELDKGQKEVSFLLNLRRILTIGSKEDGTFEMTEELKKLIADTNDPKSKHIKELLDICGITEDKKNFTKQEKENIIESIKLLFEQKSSMNDMLIQKLTKLEAEMDQTYQYLLTSVKTLHDSSRTIARGIRSGG